MLAAPVIQVTPLMGSNLIIVVFAVVVIGGMGSILGSILTGLVLGLIEGLTKVFYPEASNIVVFVIMAIVLLFKPAGPVREGGVMGPIEHRAARAWLAGLAGAGGAPFIGLYPIFMMKALCFAMFACAFNLLLGFTGLLSFGHAAFPRRGGLRHRLAGEGAGWVALELGVLAGTLFAAAIGLSSGDRDPPPGHLFLRHDHAGDGADGVLRLAAGALHRRRGRPAGRAARQAVRPVDLSSDGDVLRRAGGVRRGLPVHRARGALALRPGAQGDRENEPRALSLGYDVDKYKLLAFVLSTGWPAWRAR